MGGAERQLCTLAAAQAKLGHEVEVINLKGKSVLKQNFERNRVKVNSQVCNKNILYQVFWLFIYVNSNFEILHAHLSRAELISAIIKIKPKLIISKHNSERLIPKGNIWLSRAMANLIFKRSNAVITISKAVKKFLISISEIRDNEKVKIVYYAGENTNSFLNATRKRSLEICKYGTICRLEPQKDVETLLKAWQIHQKEFKNDELFIVGNGSLQISLQKFAKEFNLLNVKWLEPVLTVENFYTNFDVFVLSTRYEGFGLVLLEAARFNLPIIASNNSSVPEVLGSDHPGLFETTNYFQLAKKLKDFRSDSAPLKFSQINTQILEKFNITKICDSIFDIYAKSIYV